MKKLDSYKNSFETRKLLIFYLIKQTLSNKIKKFRLGPVTNHDCQLKTIGVVAFAY